MRTMLVTGASSGIGAAAVVELTRRGHRVLATGRSSSRLAEVHARQVAAAAPGVEVPDPIVADLASLDGVRRLADAVLERCPRLHVLANNAAVQAASRRLSADGYELGLAVNHLAPFLLTNLLSGRLAASGGRVVTTSSSAHRDGVLDLGDLQLERHWTWELSYGRSKLANILFTVELRRRSGLAASSFHPGLVDTDIDREVLAAGMAEPFEQSRMKTPAQGADTLVWLATSPEGAAPAASFYVDRRPAPASDAARDPELAADLWDASLRLTGLWRARTGPP